MARLLDGLKPVIAVAIRDAMSDPSRAAANLAPPEMARTATAVAAKAVEALSEDPSIQHAANTEPWFRSRVTIGAILSAAAPVLGLLGLEVSPDDRDVLVALIVAIGGIVGPAVTLYGRWIATKPLGQ